LLVRYIIELEDETGRMAEYTSDQPPPLHVGDRIEQSGAPRFIAGIEHAIKTDVHRIRVQTTDGCTPVPRSRQTGGPGPITEFLRYHVLIRVFNGRPEHWLMVLAELGKIHGEDAEFLHWLQSRLELDPTLLEEIRATVDASGLWPAERTR
jgi:hypothetical protein